MTCRRGLQGGHKATSDWVVGELHRLLGVLRDRYASSALRPGGLKPATTSWVRSAGLARRVAHGRKPLAHE